MSADSTPSDVASECIFCYPNIKNRTIGEFNTAVAIEDGFPVTRGHILVIPKRHVPNYFDLSDAERRDADNLLHMLKRQMVAKDPTITGYNIGVNNGSSAGQTVFHVHYHLIPRRDAVPLALEVEREG